MKRLLILTLVFIVVACCTTNEERKKECKNLKTYHFKLIGYKVAKHSHFYFELIETGRQYDIGSVGGRREPTIEIGEIIPVEYCVENGDFFFDKQTYVRRPKNKKSRIVGTKVN